MIRFYVKNCRVQISFWFFAAFCVLSLFDKTGMGFRALLAALIHESGHLCAMRVFGRSPRSVSLTPAGIMMSGNNFDGVRGWAAIALGGSAANLICAVFSAFSSRPSVISFAAANLFIGIVNLIPAKGLDGGEVLFGILLRMTPVKNAEAIATAVSLLCAAPAVAAGLYVLSRNPGNFSLLMVGLWLIAGVIKEYIN